MFRLLSFVVLTTLFALLLCGGSSHHDHTVTRVERLEAPAAISSPSGQESLPDLNSTLPSAAPNTPAIHVTYLSAARTNTVAPRDPFATSSILRI